MVAVREGSHRARQCHDRARDSAGGKKTHQRYDKQDGGADQGRNVAHSIDRCEHFSEVNLAKNSPTHALEVDRTVYREHRHTTIVDNLSSSEEHTSELQSLMRISYAAFCLN